MHAITTAIMIRIILLLSYLGSRLAAGRRSNRQSRRKRLLRPESGTRRCPAKFAGLTVKDGGACYLDAVDGAGIGTGPIPVKSGTPVSLAGWAVADLKAERSRGAVGIQLNPTALYGIRSVPYFVSADTYTRPGLGAALKSSSSLDSSGLKLDAATLSVPGGEYRILFLIQSDHDLLRCDTGRTLHAE